MVNTLQVNDVSQDDYLVLGLATCFLKEEGELKQLKLIEPIPSAALEAILKGIPTSYELIAATTFGKVIEGETLHHPADFPADAKFAYDFIYRAIAAARTYKARVVAQNHLAIGSIHSDLNYSLERKRVLNAQRKISKSDNVKQHKYTHEVL